MKVLVVLVIAVFTAGCNANIEFQTPSKQQLDMVKDAFWDYVAKATATAEDSLKQIRESELGREFNSLITSQDLVSTFSQEADKLKARVEKDLQPYAQEMLEMLQAKLEELKKEVETADTEALKELLLQRSQELKLQLDQSVEQLQTKMVPYAEEMKQKLDQSVEQLQTRMVPYAEEMKQKLQDSLDRFQRSFEVHVAQKAQEVRQQLAPYEEELKAKLTSENLKAQLRALWDAFSKLGQ
ncbi:apolipoprotein A-IV-like [Amphiprion ocellaris]|uniref:apolipoprotein A-IV-like n=1 Tax=Amphiprion ocellaris TaxID=80972 RepID=UPI000C30384F|nr:apolipoprotein A-IV-like [Amphiprion ocellaris]